MILNNGVITESIKTEYCLVYLDTFTNDPFFGLMTVSEVSF